MREFTIPDARDLDVAVVRGGRSGERDVSLASGAAISAALRDAQDGRGPARIHDVEIAASGAWIVGGEEHSPEDALARVPRGAVWFLALHGGEGEDGTLQGFLRTAGRRHTGSGVAASAVCMTKSFARAILAEAGLRVAPGCVVDARAWSGERDAVLTRCRALSANGYAVKPDRGGSSVATTVLPAADGLASAIERVLALGDRALVEERVLGRECTVACLGGPDEVRALMPVEIVPKDGRFFDYEEKYSTAGASEHCPPIGLDAATCGRLRELGERAHRATGCAGSSRVDFIVPATGDPVVLEINTLPGMTARSLLPLAARETGLSFRDVCLFLVGEASRRPWEAS